MAVYVEVPLHRSRWPLPVREVGLFERRHRRGHGHASRQLRGLPKEEDKTMMRHPIDPTNLPPRIIHPDIVSGKIIDFASKRFGLLTVIYFTRIFPKSATPAGRLAWVCKCDCGNYCIVGHQALKMRGASSCGCDISQKAIERNRTHGASKSKDAMLRSTYNIWRNIRRRCNVARRLTSKVHHSDKHYAWRGIKVSPKWDSFENFLADMGVRPSRGHSIDRINNDGNYEPGNCRWASAIEQQRNRRNNRRITINGVTKTLIEWCETVGCPKGAIAQRIHYGMSPENALTKPFRATRDGKQRKLNPI